MYYLDIVHIANSLSYNILIHEYVKRTYIHVHKMFIYNIGISKHKNTYDFLVQVRNFFITFELKGVST